MEIIDRQIYLLGAEAEENDLPFSEYKEDICIFLGMDWSDMLPDQKKSIYKTFNEGRKANKAFFVC